MRLSSDELKDLLQREAVRKRNPDLSRPHFSSGSAPVLEPTPSDGALGAAQVQATDPASFRVCVVSVRKRLLDEDNLSEKYLIDLCRYSRIIPDDCPEKTKIETSQRKCGKDEPEHVEITVERIP
jgi:hypothetical protein